MYYALFESQWWKGFKAKSGTGNDSEERTRNAQSDRLKKNTSKGYRMHYTSEIPRQARFASPDTIIFSCF